MKGRTCFWTTDVAWGIRNAMKKMLVVLSLLFAVFPCSAEVIDSFSFLKDNKNYTELIRLVRGEGDAMQADVLRKAMNETKDPTFTDEQNLVAAIKANTLYGRFLVKDSPQPDKETGRKVVEENLELIKELPKDSFYRLACTADAYSVLFLSEMGNLSFGIESQKALNKAFRMYPDEAYAIFLTANTYIFAPPIFGGNVVKGCNMLTKLYQEAGNRLSRWDLASLCSVIGIACYKLKDYANAKAYLVAAYTMYPVDAEVTSYLEKEEIQKAL